MYISVKEFGAKCNDKPEVYKFLAHNNGVYLPPYDDVTVWHLRDLASGKKRRIKGPDVKFIMVPQYSGLAIKHMLSFAARYPIVAESLPAVEGEILKLPRQYIANIIHTQVGQPFSDWVDQQVNARHEKVADTRNMMIELDPEIAEAFKASTAVSGK